MTQPIILMEIHGATVEQLIHSLVKLKLLLILMTTNRIPQLVMLLLLRSADSKRSKLSISKTLKPVHYQQMLNIQIMLRKALYRDNIKTTNLMPQDGLGVIKTIMYPMKPLGSKVLQLVMCVNH